MKVTTKIGTLAAAGFLIFALAGTTSATVTYATVTGHMASTNDNNDPNWWEVDANEPEGLDLSDCTKINSVDGSLGDQYVLDKDYELVVVKAGSTNQGDPNTLTLFANASAGESVWADYNPGNPDAGPGEGDKGISHIIFCDGSESSTTTTTDTTTTTTDTTTTTTNTTTTTTDTFTSSQSSLTTSSVTQPPTDTIGAGGSGNQATGLWLLVAALGVLLGSLVVVAPARAKSKR